MATPSVTAGGIPATPPLTIPVRQVLPWLVFAGILMLLAIYFVSSEQGAVAMFAGTDVHEFVHDGRHLLGFPCH